MLRITNNYKRIFTMLVAFGKKTLLLSFLIMATACSSDNTWFSKKEPLPSGERLSITGSQKKLIIDTNLEKTPVRVPHAQGVETWDHTINSRIQNIKLSQSLEKNKTFKVSSATEFATTTTPVIIDKLLIAMGTNGEITAFDYKDNKQTWENNYFSEAKGGSLLSNTFLNGGLSYYNGVIYATAGLNKVIALNATDGKLIWSTSISSPTRGIVSESNNMAFIQTIDNKLFCLNTANGNIIWNQYSTAEDMYVLNVPSVATHDNKIIVQYGSGEINAINLEHGDEIWSALIGRETNSVEFSSYTNSVYVMPIIENNIVYVNGKDGVIAALELSSGKIIWSKEFNINRQFWLAGDYIYAITDDNRLIAIHKKEGNIRWVTDLKTFKAEKAENPPQWSDPIMVNSLVITVSSEGKVMSFNPSDGQLTAEMPVQKAVYQRPIIVNDNLFLTSEDGVLTFYSTP